MDLGSRTTGLNSATWDGKDEMGNLMPTGTYQLAVSAKDGSGSNVTASTQVKGTVSGVSYANGTTLLNIGGITVRPGDVIAVRLPSQGSTTASSP